MAIKFKPAAGMTAEMLQQKAEAKLEEAAALAPGPDQQRLFISANSFRHAAEVRALLAPELRPLK